MLARRAGWRDVALIRTLSRFLRQIRVPFSQDYMWATLAKHAAIAGEIVELFHARFDPRPDAAQDRDAQAETQIAAAIEEALKTVDSLDEDRILRRFVNAVQSAIRTNYYQLDKDGQPQAADRDQVRRAASSTACRCRARSTRSSSIRRASKACICASARWRAAASAGPTGRRISAPRSSAW